MKFNRLRLLGFKSFVEPAEFVIERGLTGVVGPNGCGKSNLVEALRWVMGENSYKNMRASGMDDVIFSGSGNRPARNTAEVALFLDNTDRTAPAAFNDADEIQVTRRIEREQGSVYRINGKEARAKDVQLLFADASTGARSPSMVGQGRIGELIQAKPQARRQLLEEAAGISGLHSRRHEAELRLKGAETNLERLEDITASLDSQIDSLKRQARQASRFKMLSADIRARDAMLLYIRWVEARDTESEADAELNRITSLVAEKMQAQMEAVKAQGLLSTRLPELRDAEARAGASLQRLTIARSQLEEEATRTQRRREDLTRRLLQLGDDISREEQLMADNQRMLDDLDEEERILADNIGAASGQTDETGAVLDKAAENLAACETELAKLTAERAGASARRGQLERQIRDLNDRLDRLTHQKEEATRKLQHITECLDTLPGLDDARERVSDTQALLTDANDRLEALEWAIAEARQRKDAAQSPADEARRHLQALQTESATIARMLESSAVSGAFQPVSDEVNVERGLETALGAALGDDLDSSLNPAAPRYWAVPGSAATDPPLPPGVDPFARHVRGPAQLSRRLNQVGIVSAQEAMSLQAQLKPGQSLVSTDGAVWRWDGLVVAADAPNAAALRLEQKNRLLELETQITVASRLMEQAEAHLSAAAMVILTEETRLKQARDEQRQRVQQLAEAREALSDAETIAADLVRQRAVWTETHNQLSAQVEEGRTEVAEAWTQLQDLPDSAHLDQAMHALQSRLATDRAALAEARAAHEGAAREKDLRQRRIMAIGKERQTWESRLANALQHRVTLIQRKQDAETELVGLSEAPDDYEDKRRALEQERVKAEALRRQTGDALAEAETQLREKDRDAAAALAALADIREKRGRAEERLLAARDRRTDAESRIRVTLAAQPMNALRQSGHPAGAPLPDPALVERDLDRLKIERERLGAVNLRADEEQKDLTEKRDALTRERDDIMDAIRKLRAAIQSLNREGRERLLAAFDIVNVQFQRLFTHLFGGGTAELQLIESDDPLEAGLEILARPPGKKPQTMTLLSGGEQALTAMALIFAVFLTNPAPICVLDEVDAPLDDHNVERYCNLMDEMAASTETRFVIITHNPITMARMDRLFGVTMAEQGVSQLVSVDLQTAEQLREAV